MFTDLNKHAVTTSKSLNTLYESKEPISIITKEVVDQIPFFRKYTDKEKDNLGKYSSKLFTLNTLRAANEKILHKPNDIDADHSFVLRFWENVVINMREWNSVDRAEISKVDLRENYIATQGITILALGLLGQYFYTHRDVAMEDILVGLQNIDWLRDNKADWLNRAIKANGKINRNEQGIFLTYVRIKQLLGIALSEKEQKRIRS